MWHHWLSFLGHRARKKLKTRQARKISLINYGTNSLLPLPILIRPTPGYVTPPKTRHPKDTGHRQTHILHCARPPSLIIPITNPCSYIPII